MYKNPCFLLFDVADGTMLPPTCAPMARLRTQSSSSWADAPTLTSGRARMRRIVCRISHLYPTVPSSDTLKSFCASTANSIGNLLSTSLA